MAETLRIGRRGPVSNDSSKPCFAFRRQGSCKFGHRCRFSHDSIGQQRVSGPQPSNNGFNPARDGKLRQWKRLLEMGEGGSQSLELTTLAVGQFFQLGLELMDGDVGAAQEAIKLLATESGLAFIKAMADRHIPAAGDQASRITLWGTEVKPLFALITHPCVVDSAVLEQQVALVFNFILGVGGSRMIRVFTYITWLVKPCSTSSQNEPSQMATVELSLAVLSKVFDCNTNNIIHPEFAKLVSQFAKVVEHTSNPEGEFSRLQASKYLDYMQQRLRAGEEIPDLQSGPHVPITRDTFVLRRDLPGRLSADGPRHDNDHADINKIKIMPTYDEIMSPRGEYLPTNNPSEWHTQGIRGRLDREFRLVREDTVGQLRDAVREMLEFARNPDKNKSRGSNNSLRTYTYEYPTTIDVNLHRIGGLEMVVRCFQPPAVRKMIAKKRKDWWIQSKRLQAGALVCLFDVTGSMLFCVVSDTTMRCQDDKEARRINNDEEDGTPMTQKPLTLSDDETYLFVNLKLVDAGRTEITQAMRWYRNVGASPRRYLVEFPGVLLDSFKHTLSALQQVHEKPSIPFKALLASSESSSSEIEIEPPQYARQAGFTFNLSCLTNDNAPFTMDPRRPPTPDVLASQSTLDPTQSAALLNTLSRELSLIQGPPGTGKSYTGEKIVKVLLNSKKQAKLGPILCVCYTNHALDQLLEHLLDDGTNSIIRIGSRSKSERLQGLNLRTVVKEMLQTKSEKSGLWEAEQQIREYVRQGKDLLEELSSCESWTTVKTLLASEYHRQHAELFGEEEDGWQRVIHQPEMVIDRWLQGGSDIVRPPRPLENLKFAQLQNMTNDERRLLHRHWLKTIRDSIITNLTKLNENYNKAVKHRDEIRGDVDLRCLHMADVVGVTTTGLARNLDLLRKLRCKVMLCEEAGEVLEAHILTALLPSVEHAILIGDHLQLRPQIQNYDLQSTNPRGRQYSLDMSLFERLVQPPHETDLRVPYSVLETQRRMHPLIAELVRATLYPSLQDAETVQGYPEVVGMRQRLFWFHHNQPENAGENDLLSTSQSNGFEVEMTAALVSHLSQQGIYAPGEIAVITPYLGQLQLLRRRMETMFEVCVNERDLDELDTLQAESSSTPPSASLVSKTTLLKSVRVATVDNFQGEEAKVVVVSLVRSNPQSNCGFLRTFNRINVLLSRAQHGMYIIGNVDTYKEVPMWAHVISILAAGNNLGTKLELQCARHPKTPILVSQPDHFAQFSPESGCNLRCDKRLLCGHICTGRCHSDNLHLAVKCLANCPRLKKGCNHICPLRCGDRCHEKCQAVLRDTNLLLPCGHHISSPRCWEAQDPASIRCMKEVVRKVRGCEHSVRVRCHEDVNAANYLCTAMCGSHRICGHTCTSVCYRCNTREEGEITKQNHGICKQQCGRNYSTCRHSCTQSCHGDAPCNPCKGRCEVRCSHSRCSKACHEPCIPCAQATCESSCAHSKCTAPCAAPCDWVPCSLRCDKILDCGHQCPSLCGEICPTPTYCQQCAPDNIKLVCVDFLEMKEYHEVDLNEEPCVFPDCGHFLTVSSMDGQMEMAMHYELDENGLPTSILGSSKPFSMDNKGVKVCAICRGPLRNISRYGRIVRRAMLDEATKKFISWSNAEYLSLAGGLLVEQEKLSSMGPTALRAGNADATGNLTLPSSRQRQLERLKDYVTTRRYDAIIKFRNRVQSYAKKVRKDEQPFQRVAELVRHTNLHHGTGSEFRYDQAIIQVKGSLLASTLLLKCDVLILSDFVGLLLHQRSEVTKPDVKLNLSGFLLDCESLIQLAHSTVYPREEAQGHIFCAQLCALSRSIAPSPPPQAIATQAPTELPLSTTAKKPATLDELTELGLGHVKQARKLLDDNPSIDALKGDIDAVEETLNGGVYRPVTAEELREVYRASTGELSGTGHWYTCQNGHPFTINNCGMAMEEAACPECGARIGGRNHVSVEGVRHAAEIEEMAREMGGVRL
ncbi:hypothetical protein CDV31_011163 [Fusarium ambrosium]|uniref:Uncharacterized protein n=1 Tax=Fusarium ambrosium TaxID=131363 RepID=A0A428TIP4_9HYPO|nr:hypothetical protein CDV31_011163 [Fusarium ambrosium]